MRKKAGKTGPDDGFKTRGIEKCAIETEACKEPGDRNLDALGAESQGR